MDLSVNLQKSLEYAKKMTKDVGRWIILIILDVIPLVNFIVVGYAARVIRGTNSDEPPKLEGYVDLWVQGLKIVIASLIYMIIPIIILGVGIASFWQAGRAPWMGGLQPIGLGFMTWPLAGIAWIFILIGVVIAFLITILAAMGLVHMVKYNQFGKAFALKEIMDVIKRIGWGEYIIWLIIMFVISLIFGAVGNIPKIGWLISLILTPPFIVFISRSAGLIYESPAITKEEAPREGAFELKYCIQCGASIPVEGEYCPQCGARQ